MYSCVCRREFIDLVGLFGGYCLTPDAFFIIRSKAAQKNSRRTDLVYSKAVCSPKTHRIADFLDQRQTSIIAAPQ